MSYSECNMVCRGHRFWCGVLLIIACSIVGVPTAIAADTPLPTPPAVNISPADSQRLEELWGRASELSAQGKYREAVTAGIQAVTLELKVYGKGHPALALSYDWLAEQYVELDQFDDARKACQTQIALMTPYVAADDWRLADARWELKDVEILAAMKPADRKDLRSQRPLLEKLIDADNRKAYAEGIPVAEQVLAIRQRWLGTAHPQIAFALNNLGTFSFHVGDMEQARKYYDAALAMRRKVYGEVGCTAHPELATSLHNLGVFLTAPEELPLARKYLEESLAIREKVYAKEEYPNGHPDLATSLMSLGKSFRDSGELKQARKLHERALEIQMLLYGKETHPHGHQDLAAAIEAIAVDLAKSGDLPEAERYIRAGLAMRVEIHENYNPDPDPEGLIGAITNLSAVLQEQDKFAEARQYGEVAVRLNREFYPQDQFPDGHVELAESLERLGKLLLSQSELDEAEKYLTEAYAMRQRLFPRDKFPQGHDDLADCLGDLAGLAQERGDVVSARDLRQRALAMLATLYEGQVNQDLAAAHTNLAAVLIEEGDLAAARGEALAAHEMLARMYATEQFPNGHEMLAVSLNNLGYIALGLGDLDSAKSFLSDAVAMNERLFPVEDYPNGNHELATSVDNLGRTLQESGKLVAAAPLYERGLAMRRALYAEADFPDGHPVIAKSLNNLAHLRMMTGDLAEAQKLFDESLAMNEKLYPEAIYPQGHLEKAVVLSNLAMLDEMQGDLPGAIAHEAKSYAMRKHALDNYFAGSSEGAMRGYLASLDYQLDATLSLALRSQTTVAAAKQLYLDALATRKSSLIGALVEFRQLERAIATNPELGKKVTAIAILRQELADRSLMPADANDQQANEQARETLAKKAKAISALETEVRGQLSAGRKEAGARTLSAQELANSLPAGSALVDLVSFQPTNPRHFADAPWDPPRYVAEIVVGGGAGSVQFIDLGSADEIDALVSELRGAIARFSRDIAVADEAELADEYGAVATKLHAKVFAPLAAALGGAKRIYLAPDSELSRVAWEALVDAKGRYLIEDGYQFVYLSSGSDLLQTSPESQGQGTIVFADPQFDLAEQPVEVAALLPAKPDETQLAVFDGERSIDVRGMSWKRLPATVKEAEEIEKLLAKSKSFAPVRDYLGAEALEAVLKGLIPAPRLLHLATHGFYLADEREAPRDDVLLGSGASAAAGVRGTDGTATFGGGEIMAQLKQVENPLLRSGIVLAGANRVRDDDATTKDGAPAVEKANASSREDGWVTAEEISLLDLHGTDLVVLSACETGLGDIRIGEGVSGLRRAFLFAGAKTLVTSLYKVPDSATQALMREFYTRLAKGDTKLAALGGAQRAIIEARRKSEGAAHPFYWASFILVGDPE